MSFKDESQPYNLRIRPAKVARLKHKCLMTIWSLLECNDQIQNIIRTIPLQILTTNLIRVYQLFSDEYEDEYRDDVFKRYSKPFESNLSEEYYELIIENGFLVYNLILRYFQDKNNLESADYNEFNKKKDSFQMLTFIKELQKLGGSLFQHGLGAMKSIIKNLNKTLKSDYELRKEEELRQKIQKKELTQKALQFFSENTCQIEILRDNKVVNICFPKLPFCKMLTQEIKDEFHLKVQRISTKTKLIQLMEQSEEIENIIKHEERLRILFNRSPILSIFANHRKLWEQCVFISTLSINFMILLSYSQYFIIDTPEDYKGDLENARLNEPRIFFNSTNTNTKYYIYTNGLVNLSFSSLLVFFFLVRRAPLKVYYIWENFYSLNCGLIKKQLILLKRVFHSLYILLQDFDILYYSVYIFANIIGLIIHPFFFAFHMLEFLKIKSLQVVVQAIWQPKFKIVCNIVLLLIIEYYFTLIAYGYFSDQVNDYFQGQTVCE